VSGALTPHGCFPPIEYTAGKTLALRANWQLGATISRRQMSKLDIMLANSIRMWNFTHEIDFDSEDSNYETPDTVLSRDTTVAFILVRAHGGCALRPAHDPLTMPSLLAAFMHRCLCRRGRLSGRGDARIE
jgi:hypothetical protein